MTYALLCGGLSFAYVFMKAMQQLNVVHSQYKWVMPMSLGMGMCEVAIVLIVVKADTVMMGLVNGVGAGLGAMLAMKIHQRVTKRVT